MRLRWCAGYALAASLLASPAFAQSAPGDILRTLLAAGRLDSVVDAPLHFRLLRIRLTPPEQATYAGPNAMLFGLSGTTTLLALDGSAQNITEGAGAFIPANRPLMLRTPGPEPAQLLLFVLTPAAEAQKPVIIGASPAEELYRSSAPLPGLRAGPHEFSLTRVAFPPRMPANPPHYRSGAALYYVLAGAGTFTADGSTQPKPAGTPHLEPYGWVHQWGNPGDGPLILIQANIAQEGIPAVLPGSPPAAR